MYDLVRCRYFRESERGRERERWRRRGASFSASGRRVLFQPQIHRSRPENLRRFCVCLHSSASLSTVSSSSSSSCSYSSPSIPLLLFELCYSSCSPTSLRRLERTDSDTSVSSVSSVRPTRSPSPLSSCLCYNSWVSLGCQIGVRRILRSLCSLSDALCSAFLLLLERQAGGHVASDPRAGESRYPAL